jgi:hypothetical protein
MLTLTMKRKDDLKILIGPSARDGWVNVTRIDLERRIAELQEEMFPMDYAEITAWTGEIRPRVLGVEGVERLGGGIGDVG